MSHKTHDDLPHTFLTNSRGSLGLYGFDLSGIWAGFS